MFFTNDQRLKILKINDNFASLRKIHDDGSLEFEFRYSVDQVKAIKNFATKVNVSIHDQSTTDIDITKSKRLSGASLINEVLFGFSNQKSFIKQQANKLLFQKSSDISAFIDNSIVSTIRRGKSVNEVKNKIIFEKAGKLKKSFDKVPILYQLNLETGVSSSVNYNNRNLIHDLIFQDNRDPSFVKNVSPKVINTHELFQGVMSSKKTPEDKINNLLKLNENYTLSENFNPETKLSDVDDTTYVAIGNNQPLNDLNIPVTVIFYPPSGVKFQNNSSVLVKFEVISAKTGIELETITRQLQIFDHVKIYETPLGSPAVSVSHIDDTRSMLNITQQSKQADAIFVYKKNLWPSLAEIEDYKLIASLQVEKNLTYQLEVERAQHPIIYRCISAYGSKLSSTFSNVVVAPKKINYVSAVSLTTSPSPLGLTLEARNIPPSVIYAQFFKRNLSRFQKDFEPLNNQITIDDVVANSGYISDYCENLIDGDVYEFCVRLHRLNGTTIDCGSEIVEYTYSEQGKVNISVTNIDIQNDDVKFDVNLNVADSNLDQVKKILERQGILSYFDNDVNAQRENLKSLLAYSVTRVNLSSGEREDLGVMTDVSFSDLDARKKKTAKRLQVGHRYRYFITALVRAPETMFQSFKKTLIDPITKKSYTLQPSKFFHPYTLKKGVILSASDGIKDGKTAFEHGEIGSTYSFDVSFDTSRFEIIESSLSRFDSEKLIVNWRSTHNVNDVDHFVITREIHGIRSVVDCVHNKFSDGNFQFIHKISMADLGQIKFLIFPIFKDYVKGQASITNEILVEEL